MGEVAPITLLSGPPGAGKSAVARELVSSAMGPVVYIEGDRFWSFIAKGVIAPTAEEARGQNLAVIHSMTAAALAFSRARYEVILDFTIGPWFLAPLRPALQDVAVDFVMLCPSEAVCARRAAARAEGAIADYGPYRGLHEAFASFQGFERHTIRDDESAAPQLADRIRAERNAGVFRLT